ncbi:uncharacterized protein [Mytilus edulis]|uniref:uncharacterized protein n=2 Tax=Mytilus TaxID=6548 RepID=UPI0039F0CC65
MEDFLNEFLGESQESVDEEVFLPDISKHGRMEDDYSSLSMSPTVSNQDRSSDRDLEDIIPDTPESTLRLNTGRNLFDYILEIQQSVKELHQKIDKEKKFRIEGAVQQELNVIAKAAFGTDIFNVSDCFIDEIKQLIQLEMNRTPTALEVRMAKQHIRKKFSMEYRPAMYRTLKKNMEMGREQITRKLFKSFASTLHQTTVNTVGYRKKVVLIMRIVQRRGSIVPGTFWTRVRNLYDSIEEKIPARKLAIYEAFQRKDDRGGREQ